MKLSNALSLLTDLRQAITIAVLPTLRDVFHNPTLLVRPQALSRVFMAHLWLVCGEGADSRSRDIKTLLIKPNAYGSVLDIGAGFGHSIQYFDRARVSRYIALEPNPLMHNHIRAKANEAGFHESDGTLIILSSGAEDTHSILSSLSQDKHPTIDTMISVLTLCTVPDPQRTILKLVRDVLKPGGGQLLYFEHVLSSRPDVAWWQRFWAPVWACAFDGCRMDRPSDVWIRDLKIGGGGTSDEGRSSDVWMDWKIYDYPGQDEETLFCHRLGKFVKI